MKLVLSIVGWVFIISLFSCEKSTKTPEAPQEKLVLTEFFPNVNAFEFKQVIIDLFLEATLGSEYGSDVQNIRKWKTNINYYVLGDSAGYLEEELENIVQELHDITEESLTIQRIFNQQEANFIVVLGDDSIYHDLFPENSHEIEDQLGLSSFNYNNKYEIEFASIFVKMDKIDKIEEMHILREEFTQALGIPNDLDFLVNSILYQRRSKTNYYLDFDKAIIKILYHRSILPGMGPSSCRSLLNNILVI